MCGPLALKPPEQNVLAERPGTGPVGQGLSPRSSRSLKALDEALILTSPLLRLEELLRELHRLRSRPSEFRRRFTELTADAPALVALVHFEGYGIAPRGSPTVLHFAAGCGCLEVCAALLRHCSRLNFATDAARQTPLLWAAQSGLCDTVRLLLKSDADPEHADLEGVTALHLAAGNGCPRLCSILAGVLSRSSVAALSAITRRGLTPLHMAAEAGHADVARLLLEAGAEVGALTSQRRTALHLAALEGHANVVDCLLEADPSIHGTRDVEGMRAVDYALERGWKDAGRSLGAEESVQKKLRSNWRQRFECWSSVRVCLVLAGTLAAVVANRCALYAALWTGWTLCNIGQFRHGIAMMQARLRQCPFDRL
eukprot:TRINITY_DN24828_c0_g1_i2.p1 TRINITY_DN24828_c0_g1~~TRINITY_DN24828_c0_g1_i2.p1  ORF type:complete len:383 (-),score=57.62 TRINITY_DN24828_c0_g1_i2:225-1334(-)